MCAYCTIYGIIASMKKFFIALGIAIIAATAVSLPAHAIRIPHVHSGSHNNNEQHYVNQSDIDTLGEVKTKIDAFTETYSKQDLQPNELLKALTDLQAALKSLEAKTFSSQLGSGYTQASNELKAKAGNVREVVDGGINVLKNGNAAAREKASTEFPNQFNTAVTEYNTAVQNLDKATEEANKKKTAEEGLPYLIILIAAVLLSIVTFIWAFAKKVPQTELRKARRTVAFVTLVPLAGAVITYITFLIASQQQNGGTFTIMTGLMIFGVIVFLRALIGYHKLKRSLANTPASGAPQSPAA